MNSPADGASGNMLPKGSIDQSIGWLMIGIGVILFFLLTIMGMGQVEQTTVKAAHVHDHDRDAVKAPVTDIVGVSAPQ